MTNADCIRHMSDEQLYEFLSEWECGDIDYAVTFCDLCNEATKRGEVGNVLNLDCDGCRKHWLQRDAVEYGGLMYWKRNTVFDTADRKTENCSEIPNNCELQTIRCPKCGRTDYIRDMGIKGSCYEYKCINCNTYIKDEPTISKTEQVEDEPQTCYTCEYEWRDGTDEPCVYCYGGSKYKPKDEPHVKTMNTR